VQLIDHAVVVLARRHLFPAGKLLRDLRSGAATQIVDGMERISRVNRNSVRRELMAFER